MCPGTVSGVSVLVVAVKSIQHRRNLISAQVRVILGDYFWVEANPFSLHILRRDLFVVAPRLQNVLYIRGKARER